MEVYHRKMYVSRMITGAYQCNELSTLVFENPIKSILL